jgi:hypothetical protein
MNLEMLLYNSDKFIDLEPIIDGVKENISFWGHRYVYISGEKLTFPIDILPKRILELMKNNRYEYTDDERDAGKRIAAKINQIYEDNDERLIGKWFITRFFCYIIDQLSGYSPRFYWEEDHRIFDFYTEKQYEEIFHIKPVKDDWVWYRWQQGVGSISFYKAP